MKDMSVDHENIRRKHEELTQAFREKNRKLLQTQELYDRLKRRDMLGQVQNAASDAVDHTIQASVDASRYANRGENPNQVHNQKEQRMQPLKFPVVQNSGIQYPGGGLAAGGPPMAPPRRPVNGNTTWAGHSSQGSSQGMLSRR